MTYEEVLSQAADALLVLEEHDECPVFVRKWCGWSRDIVIGALIDAQTKREDEAA